MHHLVNQPLFAIVGFSMQKQNHQNWMLHFVLFLLATCKFNVLYCVCIHFISSSNAFTLHTFYLPFIKLKWATFAIQIDVQIKGGKKIPDKIALQIRETVTLQIRETVTLQRCGFISMSLSWRCSICALKKWWQARNKQQFYQFEFILLYLWRIWKIWLCIFWNDSKFHSSFRGEKPRKNSKMHVFHCGPSIW